MNAEDAFIDSKSLHESSPKKVSDFVAPNNEAKSGIGKFILSDQETIFKLYFYDLDEYCLTISEEV